jgi:hypothetical protein
MQQSAGKSHEKKRSPDVFEEEKKGHGGSREKKQTPNG